MQSELAFQERASSSVGIEIFSSEDAHLVHEIDLGSTTIRATVPSASPKSDLKGEWWYRYLKGVRPTAVVPWNQTLRLADLFCGPGGLANGVRQLAAELGIELRSELAVDLDVEATRVYAANHRSVNVSTASVADILDFRVRGQGQNARFSYDPELIADTGGVPSTLEIDMVVAGPPCQGHSNLNNHTRRDDRRNALYLTVPAFTVATRAPMAVIENVPSVVHDSGQVVEATSRLFEESGYHVTTGVLSASDLGWAQQRKRHFLVARRDRAPIPIADIGELLRDPVSRSTWWAIGDLVQSETTSVMDQVTELSPENQQRVDWLFDNEEYDLALSERPKSHRGGTSYTSVYGRMKKDEPAQTITTGFMSPGRGRYVHPTQRRVMTAREAARLQGFPDDYKWVIDEDAPPTRANLAKWIGDAVPMPLGYAAALSALGSGQLE